MIDVSDAQVAPTSPSSRLSPTSVGLVTATPEVSVAMIDLSPGRAPEGLLPAVPDPRPKRASISYASSEIIVEIIVIAEKSSSGFVLITQVKALFCTK
jgi:hypothetical protein